MLASGRSLYSYAFISLLACGACGGSREHALQVPQPVSNVQAVVSVTTDRQTYTTGDVIELTLELQNNSDQPLVLDFSSGQRYDFAILRTPADTVWYWSEERMFMQMLGQETVQPNQVLVYREQVSPQLPAGMFTIVGRIIAQDQTLMASAVIVVQ